MLYDCQHILGLYSFIRLVNVFISKISKKRKEYAHGTCYLRTTEVILCSPLHVKFSFLSNYVILWDELMSFSFWFCSITLREGMIWFSSLSWFRKQGYIYIFELDLIFVENGISGNKLSDNLDLLLYYCICF